MNAHVLYNKTGNKMPLLDFRRFIARAYFSKTSLSNTKNKGRPSLPKPSTKRVLEVVWFDPVGHFTEHIVDGKQRKWRICKSNVRKQCTKCNVGLHVECFQEWQKKK